MADAIIVHEYVDMLIKVEEAKIFDLWGERLVEIQMKMADLFDEYFTKQIDERIQYIDSLPEITDSITLEWGEIQTYEIKKSFLDDFLQAVMDYLKISVMLGMTNVSDELAPDIGISLSINNDYAYQYAGDRSGELITKIDEVTRSNINGLVTKAVKEWWGYRALSDAIKADYAFSRYRSTLIAAQELGQAYETGRNKQAEESFQRMDVVGRKLTQVHPDDRLCEICRPAGTDWWIPFNQLYSNGLMGTLFHIGCRCSQSYRAWLDGKKPPLPGTV